ncbi:plasma-membrane proton-efflux P-type ATPase [Lentisphaerota bacterium ZTH]|nr:plasma-membrane proton-efflux P-type ATPase [Lentisphaerota bacterium]WET06478.1 plasma-membrane proton-efflux P-type ATPase [Lentisphaerota bacterium ZTH]
MPETPACFIDSEKAAAMSAAAVFSETGSSKDGLSTLEAEKRLEEFGRNAIEEKKSSSLLMFLKFFWGPIPWMIEAAAILSLIAHDWSDFGIIMVMLVFNALIGFWEEHKASNALEALKKGLALKARACRDGKWGEIPAENLVTGDIIRVRLGDVIPADSKLIEGEYLSVDQAALTGESLPVNKKNGDVIYSGSVAKQGEMQAVVIATGSNTFFGRTARLVAGAGNISHFQQAVMRVGNFLIGLSIFLCIVLSAVVLYREHIASGTINIQELMRLAKFVLILAIASIPVAMPAVLSVTMALGALAMSRRKAIVARLQSIEEMAGVDILCSDKTGTLTKNELTLGEPLLFEADNAEECVLGGALASKAENNDAIDLAIIDGLKDKIVLKKYEQLDFIPFDPVSKRTQATVKNSQGETVFYTKGAPQVIVEMSDLSDRLKKEAEAKVQQLAEHGYRALGVAESKDNRNWRLLGIIPLFDPPRDDSAETIRQAKEHGLDVKMVTGDDVAIASEISGKLGMGTRIQAAADTFKDVDPEKVPDQLAQCIERADGFARVFPEHKYGIVKALQKRGHIVAMTGDGVNDAPALKQADAGVAVSGATDAARAAAALILTAPGLSVIIKAIETARKIFERMTSYTVYRIAMTIDVMVFVVLAMLLFPKVPGTEILFRPLTPIMIIVLALLDDIPIMTIAYDNAKVAKNPVRWHMGRVLSVSTALGAFSVIQTFGLLFVGMMYMNHELFGQMIKPEHLQTMIFLQLVVGGHLMLFVTRAKKLFFIPPLPDSRLFWAIISTQIFAAVMCGFGWLVPKLSWQLIGLVWLYNIIWMFVLDVVKLTVYRLLDLDALHQRGFISRQRSILHHYSHHHHLHRQK